MSRRLRVDEKGETWCRHRFWKRTYFSLHEAWLGATVLFVQTGAITTPYQCGRIKNYVAEVRIRMCANPWAFDPFIVYIGSRKSCVRGCGNWHLTSLTSHALRSAAGLWNLAGNYVGDDRPCMRSDGFPKKIYTSQARAQAFLDERCVVKLEPYFCARGHWHIGSKLRRPVIRSRT